MERFSEAVKVNQSLEKVCQKGTKDEVIYGGNQSLFFA